MKKLISLILSSLFVFSLPLAKLYALDWKKHSGEEITILMSEHPVLDGIRELLPAFESETGIKVNVNALAEDVYFDRMEVALRSDKGVADVYFCPMDSTAFNQYLAGLIEPLDGYLNDLTATANDYDLKDFPDGFLQSARFPGGPGSKQYCLPVSFESYILFYNKDHVNNYLGGKVPQTMDELIAAANTVKEASGGDVMLSLIHI